MLQRPVFPSYRRSSRLSIPKTIDRPRPSTLTGTIARVGPMGRRYPVAFWAAVIGISALVGSCLGLLGREWADQQFRPPAPVVITRVPTTQLPLPGPSPSP